MLRFKKPIFYSLLFSITFISCNSSSSNETIIENEQTIINETKISAKEIESIKYTEYALSDIATRVTQNWSKFDELETQIELLKKADLSFFDDENALLSTFFTDLKNEIPRELAQHTIQVRITVLETSCFKLEGINNLQKVNKDTKLKYIEDVLVSYSNLILQINKKLERDSQKIEKP